MIRKNLIPIIAILFTAGLIVSCSSSNPLLGDAESNIKSNNYDAAKTAADKYIQQNPQKPLGYYWKGIALGQEAESQSKQMPDQATPIYKNMQQAFNSAQQKASNAEEKPGELDRISPFKVSLWRTEHNTAVKLATNDSLKATVENPLELAISHLHNAVVIEPDSALSWNVLAGINGMKSNFGNAAKAQKQYLKLKPDAKAKNYLLLAQYYRQNNEIQKSIETLEKLHQKYPEDIKAVEILADSYSKNGQPMKAIATVEKLVKQDPSNTHYRLSLGTQIYQSAVKYQDSLESNSDTIFDLKQKLRNASDANSSKIKAQIYKLKDENDQLREKNSRLTERSLTQLNKVVETQKDNPKVYNTLGIIYQNKAAILFDQRNMTVDNAKAKDFDDKAKVQLRKSMKNYEKAAELDPDNTNYWRSLYQVYTALGMDQKAKEAEKKAGMQ